MTYRRDARDDQQIPLPIETVYNSVVDSLKVSGKYYPKYYTNGDEHFNRIYFNYPPEWKTSNTGEKIIGIRNMSIKWRDGELNFILYIRQYNEIHYMIFDNDFKDKNPLLYNQYTEEELHEIIIDNLPKTFVAVYQIPITIKVTSVDNWIQIKEQIRQAINDHNLYNHIKNKIIHRDIETDARVRLLEELEQIKDDFTSMLEKSNELIGEKITFFLQSTDIDIIDSFDDNQHVFKFINHNDSYASNIYSCDFLITRVDNGDDPVIAYNLFYDGPYSRDKEKHKLDNNFNFVNQVDGDDDADDERFYILARFDRYTAYFFNMDNNNPYKNELPYIVHYHKEFVLKNLMTDLQCEVAASFASQSNHNIIGRTNEDFCPIKYYKLNDDDDKFWIEFFDKNEIKIPIAINDNVVFTMDMVFLQNRKLLYS